MIHHKIRTLIVLLHVFCHTIFGQVDGVKQAAFEIGERLEFQSKVLNETRVLNIYLPASYGSDSTRKYPVIYLLDGSKDEDFIHVSGLVQFASFSWINLLPETIVVGIENVDRKRDFTYPTTIEKDKKDFPSTGMSANFIQFLEEEVQKIVEQKYHVNKEKTLIGQSLGGLLVTEILIKKPQLFTNYIIISPSLWWDSESLLNVPLPDFQGVQSIFIGVGEEGKVMKNDARRLYKKLKSHKQNNTKIKFHFFPKHDHGDVLHQALYEAFTWLSESKK